MSFTVNNLSGQRRDAYKSLDWHLRQIVQTKDPIRFIDLLAANNFVAGNMNAMMPVEVTRTMFDIWLYIHEQNQSN